MNNLEQLNLTKKLISIPSYVDKSHSETELADFIFAYLEKATNLTVSKQLVSPGRYNILATTKAPTKLLLAGHMDTVEPKENTTKRLTATTKGDKLFGLGAYDMKGSIAAIIAAAENTQPQTGLAILFYCDEEYAFCGMKKALQNLPMSVFNGLTIIGEPSELKIWSQHRGLIEVSFVIKGKSGHAADVKSGNSAYDAAVLIIDNLKNICQQNSSIELGQSTLNVARINCGTFLGQENDQPILSNQGNNIPDYAELIIEIRTTSQKLNADKVKQAILSSAQKSGVKINSFKIKHDLGPLLTARKELKEIENILSQQNINKPLYAKSATRGYSDGQLIFQKYQKPVINFGPTGGGAHGPDEWVSIKSLFKLREIYESLINTYCQK